LRHAVDGKQPGWLSIKTCLVVDASDVVRKVARHSFQSFKFDSREADTGQAALAACQAAMPEAILLDWQMPAMGSVEFLSTLRGLPNGGKPHVSHCATENKARDIALVLSSGATDYVLKPFEREAIRAKLAAAGLV
jgi:two-component system, chemotaxis family, chemotaxis protein CheY